jgi:predicted CoA-binding protein
MKPTIVLGASPNPERYAHKAVLLLQKNGIETFPIGIKKGSINGLQIINGKPMLENIHTVTLYLGINAQQEYYNYLLDLNPKRVIFNPGTENNELQNILTQKGIECVEYCTLVMLSIGMF